jgi:hypothetical protein
MKKEVIIEVRKQGLYCREDNYLGNGERNF